MQVLAFEDVFSGKICAALDRQHPRDLFDIKILYDNEGLTDDLFRVFMVYLASARRPMHEILSPNSPVSEVLFNEQFVGMMLYNISMETLDEARVRLQTDIRKRLTGDIAKFLLSLHDAEPDFQLIGLPEAANLPAVRWKLLNLEKLKRDNISKHAEQRGALEELFL